MDKIKEEIARKKLLNKGLTLDQTKQKQMEEKQRLIQEAEQREKEKVIEQYQKYQDEKILKKLKIQNQYYSQFEVDKVKIKRLDEVNRDQNEKEKAALLYLGDSQPKDQPPIERKEVQKRLRDLGQPITYFGETDWQRYKRLQQFESKAQSNVEMAEGDFLLSKQDEKQELKIQEGEDIEEIRSFINKIKERNLDPNTALVPVFKQKTKQEAEAMLLEGVSVVTRCEDVYYWCKKMLREWHIKLNEKFDSETLKRSLEGSQLFATYKQTLDYVKTLMDQLQKVNLSVASANTGVNEEILNSLYLIVRFCVYKEYVMAHDKYLELAIGNAPWPMGVTMVGIHERSGRSKIFSSQIAHILNDENQRKYIQGIKRLITISQKIYPSSDNSKMVDFRSEYAW